MRRFVYIAYLILGFSAIMCTSPNENQTVNADRKTSISSLEVQIEEVEEIAESHPDSALNLINQLIPQVSSLENELLGKAYFAQAIAYSLLAEYEKATATTYSAIKEAEVHGDSLTLIDSYNNLGIIYFYQDDYPNARDIFKQVISLSTQLPDSSRLGHALNNLGMIEGYEGNTDKELELYEQASTIFSSIDEIQGLGNIILNTGTVYTVMQEYERADNYYDSAQAIFEQLGYASGVQNTLLSKAENFLEMGSSLRARQHALQALEIAKENGFLHDETYTYELLVKIEESEENYPVAFGYLSDYWNKKEEIFNSERTKQIDELNMKYQTAQKEKEILQARLEIDMRKRQQVYLILFSVLVLISALAIIYSIRQKNKLKQNELQSEISSLRFEIQSLIGKYEGNFDMSLEEINKKLVTPLSEREYDVFLQIFTQKTNSEIAEELFVSINTVKTHLKNLYNKLGVSNRNEAIGAVLK